MGGALWKVLHIYRGYLYFKYVFTCPLRLPEISFRSSCLMKSCIKSCVSLISFVRLSSARFSTRSSCGLICTTSTPNKVDSSCIARKAFAKACCSGERDLNVALKPRSLTKLEGSLRHKHLIRLSLSLSLADSEVCQPRGCPAFDQTPK